MFVIAVASSFACCRDLRAACRRPFNGLSCETVDAYCGGDKPTPQLAHWVHHALWHNDCAAYKGTPYDFVPLEVRTSGIAALTDVMYFHG